MERPEVKTTIEVKKRPQFLTRSYRFLETGEELGINHALRDRLLPTPIPLLPPAAICPGSTREAITEGGRGFPKR
ncbi:unnamed protein product [Nezara viridula]|uniref:Uncharacterized protein n=1 Tax=Nezara viridula TaxID=85310 RepID=A0A9P0EHX8_NEZVI|nr:unnamed protein product [Nezara viridula]